MNVISVIYKSVVAERASSTISSTRFAIDFSILTISALRFNVRSSVA